MSSGVGCLDDVTTVATTALLVTHADVSESESTAVLRLVFVLTTPAPGAPDGKSTVQGE